MIDLNSRFAETVTLLRAVSDGVDRYGNPRPGQIVESDRDGCLFAPEQSQEQAEPGRAPIVTPAQIIDRRNRDWIFTDQVQVRGSVYQVQGQPQVWPSGTVVALKKVDG